MDMMKVQSKIDELLTLRASEWFEIMKDPSDSERAEFIEWLSESRRHVEEFLEITAIDAAVEAMPHELREDLNGLLTQAGARVHRLPTRTPAVSVSEKLRVRSRDTHRSLPSPGSSPTAWKTAGWIFACASIVAIALSFAIHPGTQYTTNIGEQRSIELADTSVVTLNADSQIRWKLDEKRREIDLRRGEAIFDVAHDPTRPFLVSTRAGIIQAIGTQFNVYARADGDTRVSVLDGAVSVTARQESGGMAPRTLVLKAGEEADVRADGTIAKNPRAVVANAIAWRERHLVFNSVLLEDMVVEFNRYNHSPHLRLEGVPLGTYRFAGIFDATDPQSLADLLAKEPGLKVERRGTEIVIRAR